jgi:putative Mg2+ transporter-C (MgtC) family protein
MLIGIDRELRHKPAGLRTHMLVSLGAATVMLIAMQLNNNASPIVQGVVTGIGFIGAGAILHSGRHTEGVTTAASVWNCTMIGLAAGTGYYKVMIVGTVLTVLILTVCGRLDYLVRRATGSDSG